MASENNPQSQQPGDASDDKVNKILETLPELNKLLHSVKEDLLGGSQRPGSTEGNNQIELLARSQSSPHPLIHVPSDGNLTMRLQYHLQLLQLKLGKLKQLQTNVEEELDEQLVTVQSLIRNLDSPGVPSQTMHQFKPNLEGIEKKISDLLYQVPFLYGKPEKQNAAAYDEQDVEDKVHQGNSYVYLPSIHANEEGLTKLELFRQVKQKFKELDIQQKICLLSFAVFPENREVHRTMLMYWWIGEGILPVEGPEEAVNEVLREFIEKKLIQPVEERHKVAPKSYKMSPFVHSSVVLLSKEIGLFDIYRPGKTPTMNNSKMGKVCLMEGSSRQPEAFADIMPSRDLIETVFNVSESFPDFTFKWFSEHQSKRKLMIKRSKTAFKSLQVFCLGRWERNKKRHIQVENLQLMQCFKHLTNLRILSFQGILSIRSLNSSVCKLHKLVILDLRECSDLTQLPEKIDALQNLVYLDMTGCYMMEWIPLRLALLKNLEVLKGFVVSGTIYEGVACNLNYLNKLKKLRKLSMDINRDDLGIEQMMEDVANFRALESLKVTWRKDLNFTRGGKSEDPTRVDILPRQLKKLDLQRFPHEELPTWLQPGNLLHVKKLHIGGGRQLKGFGGLPEKATQCAVEVLRLASLPKLKIGWIELKQIYFPNLTFLENYECPRVSLTPCDGDGIWRADQD